jgi:NO-binding membrane sensor protein with MHYT domain
MQGTVDGFSYGLVTPLAAYVMACLGGALGLRCTTRASLAAPSRRAVWLGLGSAAIGSGIWTMHFIAMMGFTVGRTPIRYDTPTMLAGLGIGVLMAGAGVFVVGPRGARGAALFTGGAVTGLGIASMHYLGMAAMRLDGRLEYDTLTVAASVGIAMAAATAALWAAGQARGLLWSVGASLVMGLAVSGMHYTGMAALSVRLHLHPTAPATAGASPVALLAPLLIGPLVFLCLAGAVVLFDPGMVLARSGRSPGPHLPGVPAPVAVRRPATRPAPRPDRRTAGHGRTRTSQNR